MSTTLSTGASPYISYYAHDIRSPRWEIRGITPEEIAAMAASPARAQRKDLSPAAVIGASVENSSAGRRTSNITSRTCVLLDADHTPADVEAVASALEELDLDGIVWEGWSTHVDGYDGHSLHVLVPLASPVAPDTYRDVAHALAADLAASVGLHGMWDDAVTGDVARAVYLPADPEGRPYEWAAPEAGARRPYEWDGMSRRTPPAPTPRRGAGTQGRRDPAGISGVIGAAVRVLDLDAAIAAYNLPYVRVRDGAWRHTDSTAPGITRLPGQPHLYYDWYSSSPHCGEALSVPDMIATHLYGPQAAAHGRGPDLDASVDPSVPILRRPSTRAAIELLGAREDVQAEVRRADAEREQASLERLGVPADTAHRAAQALHSVASAPQVDSPAASDLPPLPPAGTPVDPRVLVQHMPPPDSRTGRRDLRLVATWSLMIDHDPVLTSLRRTTMGALDGWLTSPPWHSEPERVAGERLRGRHGVIPVTDADEDALARYLCSTYGGPQARVVRAVGGDAMAMARASVRPVDPVRDYLDGLQWDGVSRLDRACWGLADDDEWGRAAVRAALVQAVARVMEPGCQADSSLVLIGDGGVGKSSWVRWLAHGWSTSLPDVLGDQADVLTQCHAAWVVEADEGFTGRRQGRYTEALKRFLTQREDAWRRKYGRHTEVHSRAFVVWGTTNDETFLTADPGNRRYWPVRVVRPMRVAETATDELRDQVWAEAVHAYRTEGLDAAWMSDAQRQALASAAQEAATQEDSLDGEIEDVVSTSAPKGVAWLTDSEALVAPLDGPPDAVTLRWLQARLRDRGVRARDREVSAALRRLGWRSCGQEMRAGRRRRVWLAPTPAAPSGEDLL